MIPAMKDYFSEWLLWPGALLAIGTLIFWPDLSKEMRGLIVVGALMWTATVSIIGLARWLASLFMKS